MASVATCTLHYCCSVVTCSSASVISSRLFSFRVASAARALTSTSSPRFSHLQASPGFIAFELEDHRLYTYVEYVLRMSALKFTCLVSLLIASKTSEYLDWSALITRGSTFSRLALILLSFHSLVSLRSYVSFVFFSSSICPLGSKDRPPLIDPYLWWLS